VVEGVAAVPVQSRSQRSQQGYNLVILVIVITIMNILVAASLPLWSRVIQRNKEEELRFRGLQYAEAIRVFHNRFQHYPNRLEELVELEPRSIRQLWKDPMTDDGKWGLIFQNQPGGALNNQGRNPNGNNGGAGNGAPPAETEGNENPEGNEGGESSFGGPKKGEEVQIGPIVGVRSKSHKESIMSFFGRQHYDEWQFTEAMVLQVMGAGRTTVPGAAAPTGGTPLMTTRWLGRPLPKFLEPAGGNGMPQEGSGPGGMGGFNNGGAPGGPPGSAPNGRVPNSHPRTPPQETPPD
jgi:type II secretory pathway pseudopilin PulG